MIKKVPTYDELESRTTPEAQAFKTGEQSWRLEIPGGPSGRYRLAQLDDYGGLRRGQFRWRSPCRLELQARASAEMMPGTWGFGFWNDPFSMGVFSQVGRLRLPTLPNAAWFFYAGPPNYLSIYDDQAGQGWLGQIFRSSPQPGVWAGFGVLLAPLLIFQSSRSWLRRLARRAIYQRSTGLPVNTTEWHTYRLDWGLEELCIQVDGRAMLKTELTPHGPLGLVVWIDNQYAAWEPGNHLRWGTLENPQNAWIELRELSVSSLES